MQENTEYTLVNDVTKVVDVPEKLTIDVLGQIIEVPRLPNKNCKKCYGRGYIGLNVTGKNPIFCHKCFPEILK